MVSRGLWAATGRIASKPARATTKYQRANVIGSLTTQREPGSFAAWKEEGDQGPNVALSEAVNRIERQFSSIEFWTSAKKTTSKWSGR